MGASNLYSDSMEEWTFWIHICFMFEAVGAKSALRICCAVFIVFQIYSVFFILTALRLLSALVSSGFVMPLACSPPSRYFLWLLLTLPLNSVPHIKSRCPPTPSLYQRQPLQSDTAVFSLFVFHTQHSLSLALIFTSLI